MKKEIKTNLLKITWCLPIFLFIAIFLQEIFSQSSLKINLQNPVIYYNGAIFTLERDKAGKEIIHQALRTENGQISHVDSNSKILKLKNNQTTLIDLNGKSVFPAFVGKSVEKEMIMNEIFYEMQNMTKQGFWNGSHERLALFLQAFRNLTIIPAIQNNVETQQGTIKEGKIANFIILDKNPLLYNPAKYNEIKIFAIVNEGRNSILTY